MNTKTSLFVICLLCNFHDCTFKTSEEFENKIIVTEVAVRRCSLN